MTIFLVPLDKLKEFNNKIDEELRLSESQLLSFIKSADLNSNLEGIHHLDKLLLWSSGELNFFPLPALTILTNNFVFLQQTWYFLYWIFYDSVREIHVLINS